MRVALPTLPTTCQDVGGREEDKSAAGRDGGTTHTEKKDKIRHKKTTEAKDEQTMETINGVTGSLTGESMTL